MIPLAVVAGLLVVLVAVLVWDRRRPDPTVVEMIALVDRLCLRIQAPQMAALEEANEMLPERNPVAVNPEGPDDEYWESREALADRLMAEETHGG